MKRTFDGFSKIEIIKNAANYSNISPDSKVVTFEEFKNWVKGGTIVKHIFRYEEAKLSVYRTEFIPKPFLTAILIRLLSRKASYLEDESGFPQKITTLFLMKLLRQFLKDFFGIYFLISRNLIEIRKLLEESSPPMKSEMKKLDLSASPVYLRTDLWFGIRSGGSVGHISGVLNSFSEFFEKPVFLTTDSIPMVRNDLEVHQILPSRAFWDFKELPNLCFNDIFEKEARKHLNGRRISFIYQRYSLNNYSGLKLARYYGVPMVVEYNGSEIWLHRHWSFPLKYEKIAERIELLNLKFSDMVVVVSHSLKEELKLRGIDPNKILVNPNGVDEAVYSPSTDGSWIRAKYRFNGKIIIGFIGTFGKWHGAEILAEAFGRLLQNHPEYQKRTMLFMIGDGMTMPLVKKSIEHFSIRESCVLPGLIPQEEGPEHLAACDILVASHKPNPDGTPFFGSPTKLFEYMAMGKGIIASNLNQIGEVLKHDHTAWLVKPGDVESLSEGLKMLIDDRERRERLGQFAREEVVSKYTWKEHTRKIIEKLKELYR
jgi:glycosyltransferase involved in cell wall biosynthesis